MVYNIHVCYFVKVVQMEMEDSKKMVDLGDMYKGYALCLLALMS